MKRRFCQSSVDKLFNKKFYFHGNWNLPRECPTEFIEDYSIHSLEKLKTQLNKAKAELDDIADLESWAKHTREHHPGRKVKYTIKNSYDGEFVTQAWCKFYECLSEYPVVNGNRINSVHLCEAPGAFISALNHYLKTNYRDVQWNWLSTSLNPYYEGNDLEHMIIDDRFMAHTMESWCFGEDFTGNIINVENIKNIEEQCRKMGKVNLVTADGSIDCMKNPRDQEMMVFPLAYAEVCTAMRLLVNGGNMVLKIFTIFESTTVSLLFFLSCVFRKVSVFKPVTSKPGNSEVYVVCMKFVKRNCPENFLDHMLSKILESNCLPLFRYDELPNDFLRQIENCAKFFVDMQCKSIKYNLSNYMSYYNRNSVRYLQTAVNDMFMERCRMRPLFEEDRIITEAEISSWCGASRNICNIVNSERKLNQINDDFQKIPIYQEEVATLAEHLPSFQLYQTMCVPNCNLVIRTGKPVIDLESSLFTDINIMKLINRTKQWESLLNQRICIYLKENWIPLFELKKYFKNSNFHQTERECFRVLLERLIYIDLPETLRFMKIPALSHFGASFVYFLSSSVYQEIESLPDSILCFKRLHADASDRLKVLYDHIFLSDKSSLILSFISFKKLHQNDFRDILLHHNNRMCLEYLQEHLSLIRNNLTMSI